MQKLDISNQIASIHIVLHFFRYTRMYNQEFHAYLEKNISK